MTHHGLAMPAVGLDKRGKKIHVGDKVFHKDKEYVVVGVVNRKLWCYRNNSYKVIAPEKCKRSKKQK